MFGASLKGTLPSARPPYTGLLGPSAPLLVITEHSTGNHILILGATSSWPWSLRTAPLTRGSRDEVTQGAPWGRENSCYFSSCTTCCPKTCAGSRRFTLSGVSLWDQAFFIHRRTRNPRGCPWPQTMDSVWISFQRLPNPLPSMSPLIKKGAGSGRGGQRGTLLDLTLSWPCPGSRSEFTTMYKMHPSLFVYALMYGDKVWSMCVTLQEYIHNRNNPMGV